MSKIVLLLILILTFGTLGCTGSSDTHKDEGYETGEPRTPGPEFNGTDVQGDFENAHNALETAVERGDIQGAQAEYERLEEMYLLTNEIMGEEHLENFFSREDMDRLGDELESGDLRNAKETLTKVGSSCGAGSCHNRVGSSMAKLEVEYGIIKRAVKDKDLEKAGEHMPYFSQYWAESKGSISSFMPEQAETYMNDSYLAELNRSIEERDLEASEQALDTISGTTCSVSGCHRVFFTDESTWKFF